MKAVIYARYSSDNQREASIDDQVRNCRNHLDREGWDTAQIYSDAAISGATTLRPGYQALLKGIRENAFDLVLAESLDRLSRDQEDVARLYKLLNFSGIKLITLSEGEINELHVGLKGTMNALFLKDLAQKTHRGLEGRVRKGRSAGGLAYGYDVVKKVDGAGEPIRGERRISEGQATAVRRIFELFAQGHSPRAIARTLNAEDVLGPKGRPWQDTTIRGHATRRTGILRNDLYRGQLVWNKQHYVKDPKTGRRLARPNPQDQWIVEDVPHLRIIDDELWQKVQDRLDSIRSSAPVKKARETKFWEHRRARHLLTGLLHCSSCGSPLSSAGKDYLACGKARRTGTCDNTRGAQRHLIEEAVLDCLKNNLMEPDLVETFIREFHAEANKQTQVLAQGITDKKRKLEKLTARLDGLYVAIADGLRTPGLKTKIEEMEAELTTLKNELDAAPPPAPILHPNLAELYRRKVEKLHEALNEPNSRSEAAETLRGIIERIDVAPLGQGAFEIDLVGDIVNMIELAETSPQTKKAASNEAAVPDVYQSSVKVVAGAVSQRLIWSNPARAAAPHACPRDWQYRPYLPPPYAR
jgi:DNA invertase Pin-like site-specific DNA recombinase